MGNFTPQQNSNFLKRLFSKPNDVDNASFDQQSLIGDNVLLNYYSSLAMYHPDLIIVFSRDGEIHSQNKSSILDFFGYSPRKKEHFKKILSKDSYQTLLATFNRALEGNSEKHELTLKNNDNEIKHIVVTFIPIKVTANEIEGVYVIIEDITTYVHMFDSLERNEKHLAHAQVISDIGSWEYIIDKDILYCSENFYHIFGIDESEHVTMNKPYEYVHPDDYNQTYENMHQATTKGTSYTSEFRIYHGKTQELRYITVRADAIWKDDKPFKLIGVVRDVTAEKRLEHKYTETIKNLEHIFNNINAGFWMRESFNGKIMFASKGLEDILQIPLKTLKAKPDIWKDMIIPEHRDDVFNKYKLLKNGESIQLKFRITCEDGTTKWVLEQTTPLLNKKGEVTKLFGMVTDITHEVGMHERLKFVATHDGLTNLPNQRSLYEKLDAICKKNRPFAILYLDLDRFNIINDSLGHQIGDVVLKHVASRLISIVSKNGYIARLGSNDFIILDIDYENKEDVFHLAERIIKAFEKPMTLNDYEIHVTTSIGISFFPEDGTEKIMLLEKAHSALYYAKLQGKNNFQTHSISSHLSSVKKYIIEKDLRKAIENGEFELYYQPIVEPDQGIVQIAEALIRWNHEEWGFISPSEFIPLAEENHLIHYITKWVIIKVCSQLREWKDKEYSLRPISINLSPVCFFRKGMVEFIEEQLNVYDIQPKYLVIEITENSLLRNEKNVISTINALKKLGIQIAIDDFGTGYASLNYLRQFQADFIKIDKVFIEKIQDEDETDAAIVSSILHLAEGLNKKVVAEGVEEYEQLEFLKQKECHLIQGYLFSKPVPTDKFEQIMKTGFLKPKKGKINQVPKIERRKYYRFEFPYAVRGQMTIVKVNKKKVNLGSAEVLIENISLGGIKAYTNLRLPVSSNMTFRFDLILMGEAFNIDGSLIWKNEGKGSTFYYGIKFDIKELDEDRLVNIINRMTVLRNLNNEIPDTDFIYENPYLYLSKNK